MLDDTRTGLNGAVPPLLARIATSRRQPADPRRLGDRRRAAKPALATAPRRPRPPAAPTPTPPITRSRAGDRRRSTRRSAVVEAEVSRLRGTVLAYGEALKEIEVYGSDPSARGTAAAALRRAPERLRAAPPVPHCSAETSPMADVAFPAGARLRPPGRR